MCFSHNEASSFVPTVPLGCLPICYCIGGTLASAMLNNASHLAKSLLAPRQSRRRARIEETMSRDFSTSSQMKSEQWDVEKQQRSVDVCQALKFLGFLGPWDVEKLIIEKCLFIPEIMFTFSIHPSIIIGWTDGLTQSNPLQYMWLSWRWSF